jgi:hypothetical protein
MQLAPARLRRRSYRRAALEHCTALCAVALPDCQLRLAAVLTFVRLGADEQIVLTTYSDDVTDRLPCPDKRQPTTWSTPARMLAHPTTVELLSTCHSKAAETLTRRCLTVRILYRPRGIVRTDPAAIGIFTRLH